MRSFRLLLPIPLVALTVLSFAQEKRVLGKVGETNVETAIYSTPSKLSRVIRRLYASSRVVIKHSDRPDWDSVLLSSGRYGYTPAADVNELPYIAYYSPKPRNSSLSSRGGSRAVAGYDSGSPIVNYALKFEGTPYKWGGNDLTGGIDCSGFVKNVISGTIGYNLPRTAAEQALVGMPIHRLQDLRAGDRLYFRLPHETHISHTGIYMGNALFVHSSHGKGGVSTDSLLKGSWLKILVAARR